MIALWESGYARQTQIARAFGYSVRILRRYQERFEAGGVGALVRGAGRPSGRRPGSAKERGRDQTILHLKTKGSSNRAIAGKLALSETAIRKRLRRRDGNPGRNRVSRFTPPAMCLPRPKFHRTRSTFPRGHLRQRPNGSLEDEDFEPAPVSRDPDPLDRSMDHLLASLGLIEDAAPVFAPIESLPRAGVLLAIPPLVASGVLSVAHFGTVYMKGWAVKHGRAGTQPYLLTNGTNWRERE